MAETLPKTLAGRLSLALSKIKRIPKRGRNDAMNYNFVRSDDVAEGVRDILFECGVAVNPDVVESGVREVETKYKDGTSKVTRISTCLIAWTFINIDDPADKLVTHTPGEGMDTGDKGVYKAMTGSMKYALMLGFLIPTGDGPPVAEVPADPENESEHDQDEKNGSAAPKSRLEAVKGQVAAQTKGKPEERKKKLQGRMEKMGFDVAAMATWVEKTLGKKKPETSADLDRLEEAAMDLEKGREILAAAQH